MSERVYNFSAGPATLPLTVLEQAQRDLVEYPGAGMSVLEMSHRSAPYDRIIKEAEADLRALIQMDHTQRLRGLTDAANGALVTFVPVTGEALGAIRTEGEKPSAARVRDAQVDSLRFIADNTNGAALTVPGERGGLGKQLESEHAPYYLVTYRPTSSTLDGRFRGTGREDLPRDRRHTTRGRRHSARGAAHGR